LPDRLPAGAGLGLADDRDVDLPPRARAVQAPAPDGRRARRAHGGRVGSGIARGAGGGARRRGAGTRAARRAAAGQPAADDEAAGQPGLRADGPARDAAHRDAARRRGAPHARGCRLHAARDGGRPRCGRRARRPVRRLRAGAPLRPLAPVGVVLAGGAGRRMGGAKATALLAGRPLVAWAVEALRAGGLDEVAVAAKASTVLPALDVPVWLEPEE